MIERKIKEDFYRFYKTSNSNPVRVEVFATIMDGFIKFLMAKLFSGFDIQLSTGSTLGIIGVRGKRIIPKFNDKGHITNLSIDWKSTNELWARRPDLKEIKQLVYHMNEHTNMVRYKIHWLKTDMKLANKLYYSFIPSRRNKRSISKVFKSGTEFLII